jgi:hypothetical protein
MVKKRNQRFHLLKRIGSEKITSKHSFGGLKMKLLKTGEYFIMQSVFKEDCGKEEKPGWKKVDKLEDCVLYRIAENGLLSTKKRKCKKEVKTN